MENLEIYESVRKVPEEAKKTIKGGRLSGMTDINPMWRIKTLTEQFGVCGFGWYTEIVNKEIYPVGEEIIASVDIKLYIKLDGEWSQGITGTGGAKLVAKESKGLYNDDEAFKKAETDAISVCCKKLGIGADVYWAKDGESKYNPSQHEPIPYKYICDECGDPIDPNTQDIDKSIAAAKTEFGVSELYCRKCYAEKRAKKKAEMTNGK